MCGSMKIVRKNLVKKPAQFRLLGDATSSYMYTYSAKNLEYRHKKLAFKEKLQN